MAGLARRFICLSVLLLAAIQLTSCGGNGGSAVVVKIGDTTITKAALERWTNIEAVVTYNPDPQQPVPKGAIPHPPHFTSCISFLRATAPRSGARVSTGQLESACRNQYKVLRNQILEILITTRWLTSEAKARGLEVTAAEVRRVVHKKFKTPVALRRFLEYTGEKDDDEVFLLKRTMQANRFTAWFKKPGVSPAQAEKAQIAFFSQTVKRWTARTSCSKGYVVTQCRQAHVS
jgi:hypothetical protein